MLMFDAVFYSTPFVLDDILLIRCRLGVGGLICARRDVVLCETNRWDDNLTYIFIWITLNRKEGTLLRRGKIELIIIIILHFAYYTSTLSALCTSIAATFLRLLSSCHIN